MFRERPKAGGSEQPVPVDELLGRLLPRLYRFALRLTGNRHSAEDLAQETCLRAWRNRWRLRQPRSAAVWLFRIMLNTWRDERRRDAHRASRVRPLTENRPASANSTEGRAAGKETLERVLAALESLPPRQKQVLHLAMIEELSISEIAEVLSSNRDAVKANLSLARKQMRELLGDLLNP